MIKWSTIDALGKNKALSSSYIWVLIVPLMAKSLQNIHKIEIPFVCEGCFIELNLPFSWVNFYYSALFIAIGKVIYTICCPKIISNYQNYTEFLNQGRGVYAIRDLVCDAYDNKKCTIVNDDFIKKYIDDFYSDYNSTKSDLYNLCTRIILEEKGGDAFFRIRDAFETYRFHYCFISLLFYLVGILLLLMVLIDNTVTVFRSSSNLFLNFF